MMMLQTLTCDLMEDSFGDRTALAVEEGIYTTHSLYSKSSQRAHPNVENILYV